MSLSARAIDKSFLGTRALSGVTLELVPGTIHALVGENGAGKSTLLQIMAGIYRPDGGEVTLLGVPVYENPEAKSRIAFVPTRCALFPGYDTRGLVKLFRSMYPVFNEEKFEAAISGLSIGRKTVRRLSTGLQMSVSVALALAVEPDVLLLDEPFAGLDVLFRRRLIQALIEESASRPLAILVSSHNVDELERLCDSVTFLSRGKVAASGELADVKRGAARRLQVVFAGEAPGDLASWSGVLSVKNLGRVFTLGVDGSDHEIEARLKACNPVMLEELPVTLEDAFVYSYEHGGKQ